MQLCLANHARLEHAARRFVRLGKQVGRVQHQNDSVANGWSLAQADGLHQCNDLLHDVRLTHAQGCANGKQIAELSAHFNQYGINTCDWTPSRQHGEGNWGEERTASGRTP